MTLETKSLPLLSEALTKLETRFDDLPPFETSVDVEAMRVVMDEVATRMLDNYPYPHPFYAGQMLKTVHPMARIAYAFALWINPNNHALDGGRASSFMEKEAVAQIAEMFGWHTHLGHLTGGGTMANMEALWIAGCLHPDKKIVASQQAHYTHARLTEVLKIPFQTIPCDSNARMDLTALEDALKTGEVGTVVATLGTSGAGSVDGLVGLLALQEKYGFRIHADAAYGGYFKLADNLAEEVQATFDSLHQVDSIAIDPHKQGMQPFGCGCIVFKDPTVGSFYRHDSPYTYFSSDELHLGEISLECSRAGASAVALWATQRLLPLEPGGEFALSLSKNRKAAIALAQKIDADPRFQLTFTPDLDIVIWMPLADRASQMSQLAQTLFDAAATEELHLAVSSFPRYILEPRLPAVTWDAESILCLRSCLVKEQHYDWLDRIWDKFSSIADRVLGVPIL